MILLRLCTFLGFISPSVAGAQPTHGTLIGQVDGDPVQYSCSPPDADGKLRCEFIQVLLSPVARDEDLQASLAQIPDILSDDSDELDGLCGEALEQMRDTVRRFEAGQSLEDGTLPPDDPRDLESLRRFLNASETVCNERTAETLEAFFRFTNEQQSKTCRPFFNEYNQTFVQVSEQMWVAESSPFGPCGIVQASRFSLPESGLGVLWEYTSQKIITNPTGEVSVGMSCSGLDQSAILYTWKSGPQRIDCEFID